MSPTSTWKALSPEEKEVIKKLGLTGLFNVKQEKRITSYILKRITTCNICNSVFTNYLRMASFPKETSLISIKIEEKDILPADVIKEGTATFSGCSQCYPILSRRTKRELIRDIIRLTKKR